MERRLKCWGYSLEGREIKESRSKTEYQYVNGENDKETVTMEDTKMPRVIEFKVFGLMVQESDSCEIEVKRRV